MLVFSLHHNHKEDPIFVPAAEPAHPPIIDMIAKRHRLAKPKELGLNVHGLRPHTSMAQLGRTVNVPFRESPKALWDSGVRDALHQAAEAEGCNFPGLGPHSFRRANITWRQQVGGSAIEASKIAGHSDLEMTGEYTFVTPERQNELTRRIQQKLTEAKNEREELEKAKTPPSNSPPDTRPAFRDLAPATSTVQ